MPYVSLGPERPSLLRHYLLSELSWVDIPVHAPAMAPRTSALSIDVVLRAQHERRVYGLKRYLVISHQWGDLQESDDPIPISVLASCRSAAPDED